MQNNLAELRSVDIDIGVLRTEWEAQVVYQFDHAWEARNYVSFEFFTAYYKQLLLDIENKIGETPLNYIIQMHDPKLITDKWYLNIAHKDADRLACITIPVYYNRMEPINFYDDVFEKMPEHGKPITTRPNQVGQYSECHPTLVNVNNYHNVRILDEVEPRIFIQMSYNIHFDDLIEKNKNMYVL